MKVEKITRGHLAGLELATEQAGDAADMTELLDCLQGLIAQAQAAPEAEPVALQCREIGESDWEPCDKAWFDYCERSPHHDTRKLYTHPAPVKTEPVQLDVVGYASPGQIEVLRKAPRTGGMKVRGVADHRYTEPLVTLANARSALFQVALRCEQAGAFKACLECGYQDGHDEICKFHESRRTRRAQPAAEQDERDAALALLRELSDRPFLGCKYRKRIGALLAGQAQGGEHVHS